MIQERISNEKDKLNTILSQNASKDAITNLEIKYKKIIKEFYSELKQLSPEEKKIIGKEINGFKMYLESKISDIKNKIITNEDNGEMIDFTVHPQNFVRGKIHPLIRVGKMLENVYEEMGFSIVYGPEIENDKHNYEMLNMPYYHPARDMQDTFYLDYPNVLLRSHTSCVQIRHMKEHKPPFKILSPGVVYRVDEIDPQHTPCFYQVEGLVVGEGISFSNLKAVLIESVKRIFGENYKVRFTPSYYPYTEPSAAIDMSCIICAGSGCRTCKNTGWMRVAGAGMVHPNVFEAVGYPKDTLGFAFGWGLNKFPMIYYEIAEMRKLFENDIILWEQL